MGRQRSAARRHEVINPSTEEACTEITLGTTADVDAAVAARARAFESLSQTTRRGTRSRCSSRIVEEYKKRVPDLAKAMAERNGRTGQLRQHRAGRRRASADFLGTIAALKDFELHRKDVRRNTIVYEPIGVVGMITPWNWPLNQIALKVAPALAAGNTMILKPSRGMPRQRGDLRRNPRRRGRAAGRVQPGPGRRPERRRRDLGASATSTWSASPDRPARASRWPRPPPTTVKRVHQELGGKSPNLVLPDADFAAVLPPTLQGVLVNSGQSCIAPTRLLVPPASARPRPSAIAKAMFEGDPGRRSAGRRACTSARSSTRRSTTRSRT